MVLTSNSSKTQFTKNKPCAITCHVSASYNLEGRWKVCLWSLCVIAKVVQDNVLQPPPGTILVYTVILTDTVIGDATASLLAVLLLFAKRALTKFTPAQLAYLRVKARQLTDISIKLADLNSKNIDFDGDETIVLVELHFRRAPV